MTRQLVWSRRRRWTTILVWWATALPAIELETRILGWLAPNADFIYALTILFAIAVLLVQVVARLTSNPHAMGFIARYGWLLVVLCGSAALAYLRVSTLRLDGSADQDEALEIAVNRLLLGENPCEVPHVYVSAKVRLVPHAL